MSIIRNTTGFSFHFFWRDFKTDKGFNWFFILCASLGIIGLLLVESFKIGVEEKVEKNAKNFIASDLAISTRRALEDSEIKKIENYLQDKKFRYAKWTETYSLVTKKKSNESSSKENVSKLADLNFVTEEFPFYGGVILEDSGKKGPGNWNEIHQSPILWMSRDLSWELGVKVGDEIKVGEIYFKLGGIILEDQFSSFRGFNLAPKIFLSYRFLTQTDLVKFGSTATFSYSIKLPEKEKVTDIQKELRKLISDKSVKITGAQESSEQIARSLNLLTDYLSLITLLTYLLSLVGLYYFTQYFLSKKLKTFSIYKALGMKTSVLFKCNFFHLVILILSSVLVSTSLVLTFLPLVKTYFSQLVGEELIFSLSGFSMVRILTLSLGGSLLALGPLFWGALQIPVATIFQDLPAELKRIKFYYFIPLLVYILALAVFLSNSIKTGLIFIVALAIIVLLAAIAFKIFTLGLDKLSSRLNFINKQATRTLSRYFTSSFTIFVCLLIGMTLTTFIFQLEGSLRQEFTQTYGDRRPDLFLFDLQDTQAEKFEKLVQDEKWNRTTFSPMIRGRLLKINETAVQKREEPGTTQSSFQTREDENSERMRNRGVNLSYRPKLSWSETIEEGVFNGETCDGSTGLCGISLEKSYAGRLGAKIGDKLTFDISGIEISGVVTSLRSVKWASFEPNFFILFQPGILNEAPKTFLSSIKVKSFEEKRAVFSKMAEVFPSVSLIEVSELVKKITTIFDLMATAIKFISFLSLFVALVVLVAVSFNHLGLRKREMGLFYMLGLKSDTIKSIYSREFSLLISLCLFLSIGFGSGLTAAIMNIVFSSETLFKFSTVLPVILGLSLLLYFIVVMRVKNLVKTKNLF